MYNKNSSNEQAGLIIAVENMKLFTPHIAETLKIYFDELIIKGFSENQALEWIFKKE